MSVNGNYISIKYAKPRDCSICMEQTDTLFMHGGGEKHPACKNCVERWAIEKIDNPTCAVCKCPVSLKGILSNTDMQNARDMKEIDVVHARQKQVIEDERMAREMAGVGFRDGFGDGVEIEGDLAMALALNDQLNGNDGAPPPEAMGGVPGDAAMARALDADLNGGIRQRRAAPRAAVPLALIPAERAERTNYCAVITTVVFLAAGLLAMNM